MGNLKIVDELIEYVDLRFNHIGSQTHDSGWSEYKAHPDYDLWYVSEGEVVIEWQGRNEKAVAGDIVFFNPGMTYRAYSTTQRFKHDFIHFDFSLGQRFNFLNEFALMGVIKHYHFRRECKLFLRGLQQYFDKEPLAAMTLKGAFIILLAKLLSHSQSEQIAGQDILPASLEAGIPQTKQLAKLQPVFDHIEQQIMHPISPSELAKIVNMSPKYFFTYFKKNVGITPLSYITKIKMNRARELLIAKQYTVKEIAYQLGYPDPYTFSKIFKRIHKTSPSKFFDYT